MEDSEKKESVCHDIYAKNFMDERGLNIFSSFSTEKNPNAGNVARHRIIDDFIRNQLSNNHELQIILIGAGFDSRAYRINGGTWIELDEPQVISYKNDKLPIEQCKNELRRIPIDFETESFEDKLREFSSVTNTIVVFEGVFLYLQEDVIKQILQILHKLFPKHQLVCDLMTEKFYKKYSYTLHQKINKLGANYKFTLQKPSEVFCNYKYSIVEKHSVIGKAIEYGSIKVPKFIFKTFLNTLEHGYSIYIFESAY